MSGLEKYRKIMSDALSLDAEAVSGAEYQKAEQWDSVGHMALVAAIEEGFDIMLDTEDIIDFSSYEKGIEILRKYDVDI